MTRSLTRLAATAQTVAYTAAYAGEPTGVTGATSRAGS